MKRRWLTALICLLLLVGLALWALDSRLLIRRYELACEQIEQPVRLVVLTDYHGCDYGENGAELVEITAEAAPDLILLVGDMFSADGDPEEELAMFSALTQIAPAYYVTGNHEYWEYDVPALMNRISETGVTVLDQSCVTVEVAGNKINLCGVPDPYAMVYTGAPDTALQLSCSAEQSDQEAYTILLAHRPELLADYAALGKFDLVLSGHAHGGQVRIPGLLNGLYAPNQGFFPKYAGGRYEQDGMTMLVSRGLSDQVQMGIPRIFNRPELLIVDLR